MLPTKYISPQGLPIFLKLLVTSLRTKLQKSLLKRQVLFFFFQLHNIALVLPYIKKNPPQVYTCSPSWTLLPPASPYQPPGSSQCTSPKHPALCTEPGLVTQQQQQKRQVLIQGAVHWGKFSSQQQLQVLDLRLNAMGFRQVNLGRHKAMRNISKSHKIFFFFKYACLLTSTIKKTDKSIPQSGQRETLC